MAKLMLVVLMMAMTGSRLKTPWVMSRLRETTDLTSNVVHFGDNQNWARCCWPVASCVTTPFQRKANPRLFTLQFYRVTFGGYELN